MKPLKSPDGNIFKIFDGRSIDRLQMPYPYSDRDVDSKLQMHSSLVQRLSLEMELEAHLGCVNALAWNSKGSLLVSGSDDARVNIWSYSGKKLLHSIDTGHSSNIFCCKFIPETGDELVVSGAGDAEVRAFRLSRSSREGSTSEQTSVFRCHSRRVKKLAVEDGNPHVVWSASEDGTLRQHDFRESLVCPVAGSSNQECRNVLLDLRSGAKKSLADPPRHILALKSCDISATRPHQLLVGGSDAFARLYDRRMLPPLSSSRKPSKPPPCVCYFCPAHLSDYGRSSLHLTHVTFSPNGEEILLSYSGEHVYLMDVNNGQDSTAKYIASDVPKRTILAPVLNGMKATVPLQPINNVNLGSTRASSWLKECRELLEHAQNALKDGKSLYVIEATSEILDVGRPELDLALRHDCLCTRAAAFLKRLWKNDTHMAIRDCNEALNINPISVWAHIHMADALSQLGKYKEALDYTMRANVLDPSNNELAIKIRDLREKLFAAEDTKNNKKNDGESKLEKRPQRARSLSELLFRSEASDSSHDSRRVEREDSDYDDDMDVEMEFEMSVSGDDERDTESGLRPGSLNLRVRRRGDTGRDSGQRNSDPVSPPSGMQNEDGLPQVEIAVDMRQRYVGHCNVGTDIKQASFLGRKGDFVASGSDDGRWFIWEKRTGRLMKVLTGDETVVNCVQCHPFDCTVATSGIDNSIKLWIPCAQLPSIVSGGVAGPETADLFSIMAENQNKMCHHREIGLPFEILQRFRMHDVAEGTVHPFECTQS